MYDRETETLWRQFTGEPILGPLVDSGIRLDFFPVVITTWEQWFSEHPDTTVLALETGLYPGGTYFPETDRRAIYNSYFNSAETMFPVPFRDDSQELKDLVLALGSASLSRPTRRMCCSGSWWSTTWWAGRQ
jgi:hypothetical protein